VKSWVSVLPRVENPLAASRALQAVSAIAAGLSCWSTQAVRRARSLPPSASKAAISAEVGPKASRVSASTAIDGGVRASEEVRSRVAPGCRPRMARLGS
jgi:hypothetical protein